jgi:AmmeMemoRadiSam system protein A
VSEPAAPSLEERRHLLDLARRVIAAHLDGAAVPADEDAPDAAPQGAFVSLKGRHDGQLRGCIGHAEGDRPLVETIRRVAVAAATEDPRFPAVTRDELSVLRLEISVLSPLEPILPEDVEVGRHGLLVRFRGRSGLLLPQVAVAQRWDREAFLDYTCRKAGLPMDSWRHPDCVLMGFTATVFAEE